MDFGLCKGKPIPQNSLISGSGNPLGFLATFGQACDHLGGNHKFPSKKCQEDLGVSENSGTPKSSILIGFSIIDHPFWGTPILGNTHFGSRTVSFFLAPWPPFRLKFAGSAADDKFSSAPNKATGKLFFSPKTLFSEVILSASRFPSS